VEGNVIIITKTPLRIGFAGGGSDLPEFCKNYPGSCVNATIDKYVYVLVKKRYDNKIYLKYSENEIVEDIKYIKHDFIRETLDFMGINYGLEIINWADIPTRGTGLGSSSSFLVGLLNALYTLEGKPQEARVLAEQACHIEIDRCKKPIGYQDQFAAAYGGLNYMQFKDDEAYTSVTSIGYNDKQLFELSENIQMFYTGITRDSSSILSEQSKDFKNSDEEKIDQMSKNVDLANMLYGRAIDRNYDAFGAAMLENWAIKKTFNRGISNAFIDRIYEVAESAGMYGGKITGAGGGGFFIAYSPVASKSKVIKKVCEVSDSVRYMPVRFDPYGSRVLLNCEEYRW